MSTTCGSTYPISSLSNFYSIVGYITYVCKSSLDKIIKESGKEGHVSAYNLIYKFIGPIIFFILSLALCLYGVFTCFKSKNESTLEHIDPAELQPIFNMANELKMNFTSTDKITHVLSQFENEREKRIRFMNAGLLLFAKYCPESPLSYLHANDGSKDCMRIIFSYAGLVKDIGSQRRRRRAFLSATVKNPDNTTFKYGNNLLCRFFRIDSRRKYVITEKIMGYAQLLPPTRKVPYVRAN